jgi:hypothetical protein
MTTTYTIYQAIGLGNALFDVGTFTHTGKGTAAALTTTFYTQYSFAIAVTYYLAQQRRYNGVARLLSQGVRTGKKISITHALPGETP